MSDSNDKGMLKSTFLSNGKDLISLLRDTTILIIVLLLLFFPGKINDVLVKAGFEEGSFAGIKWKASLTKSDLALKEAQATITSLSKQLDSMNILLKETAGKITDPVLKQKVERYKSENKQLKSSSSKMQDAFRSTISANASLVRSAQEGADAGEGWGVVFSGDISLKDARYEVETAARKQGIDDAQIFYRQGSYRSVKVVYDREEAEALRIKAKSSRYKDAYIVPMSSWCPSAIEKEGYKECAGSGTR